MDYRREIDGLRAFAVLPVILFHAGFEAFSGGFVGVDVFFVISGYLITTIILAELEQGKFSIVNFYERRARRILPALFLVMVVCIPFAWFWLLPSDMKGFSQSLVAVSVFASNILFWRESGYFDTAAELKPLLHTWSLAVEEQYYVLFPLFLMLTWRFGKQWILFLLAAVGVVSLSLAQWGAIAKPDAAFHLLPTRGWELLIGAFAAFFLSKSNQKEFSKGLSEVGGALGLALILYSVFAYDKLTPFPGLYALVPTVGAVLIIIFGTQQTTVGKFIGNKTFVGIGLISYSAYLWHQPIFSFARHNGLTEFHRVEFIFLSLLSLLLAYVSWRFIEKPFRNKQFIRRAQILIFGLIGSLFFVSFGLFGHIKNGDIGQLNAEQKNFLAYFENEQPAWKYFMRTGILEKYRMDCNFYDIPKYRIGEETMVSVNSIPKDCYTSNKASDKLVFIWGDSHAQQLYYGIRKILPNDYDVLQVASSRCVAKVGAVENKLDFCEYSNWFAFNKIQELKPKFVIVGQNLGHNVDDMRKISDALKSLGVNKVIFTGPSPHWSPKLPKIIASKFLPDTPQRTFIGIDKGVLELDQKLKSEFYSSSNVFYLSLIDYFCNADGCLVHYNDVCDGITSWDVGHLTPIASYNFARDVLPEYFSK